MRDERVYLGHIRDAINDIEQYTSVRRDAFVAERMRQDAVIRKLEIIGEAVKHLSDATKDGRPEIPRKQIAGMRDRLTHDYLLFRVSGTAQREVANRHHHGSAQNGEPRHGQAVSSRGIPSTWRRRVRSATRRCVVDWDR